MDASIDTVASGPKKGAGTTQVFTGAVPVEAEEIGPAETAAVVGSPRPAAEVDDDPEYPAPTEEERSTLPRVAGRIPAVSYVLCVVELAERASYYGASTVFSNFMQFPLPKGGNGAGAVAKGAANGHAGALGKGLQFASAFSLLFTFLAYVFPILGAWIADTRLGRYKTIMLGVVIGAVAHVIMIGGAAPAVLRAGHGVAPFVISLFLLAIGAGIFKPNVAPTVIDQYRQQRQYVRTNRRGEREIVDPERTIQRIMLLFYAMINVGAFFAIATTYTEKYVGFWLAFLLPGLVYILLPVLLLAVSSRISKRPPVGSELTDFVRITWTALRRNRFAVWRRDFWAAAAPEAVLAAEGRRVTWTTRSVADVQRTFAACLVFLYFPVYNINDGGIGSVSSNQGAAMTTNGAPNDLLNNMNPVVIIASTPILTYVVYPLLARYRVRFGPIRRMTFGFLLAAVSGAIGAIVQWRVYATSPCGYHASTCDDVSPLSVWWQIPNVGLGALSELFCNVTAYELAYARAPPHLKSVVMAMFLFTNALSSALGEILIPAIIDPHLIWVWAGPAIALFVQTIIFYVRHHHIDDEVYMLEQENLSQAPLAEEKV